MQTDGDEKSGVGCEVIDRYGSSKKSERSGYMGLPKNGLERIDSMPQNEEPLVFKDSC